jgi:hypothetical protein
VAILISRPFRDEDIPRLRRFLAGAWLASGSKGGCFHVGDLLWARYMYEDAVANPAGRARIWEGFAGDVRAFAWFYPPAEVALNVHPRFRGEAELVADMLTWADERRREFGGDGPIKPLMSTVLASDDLTSSVLTALGFVHADHAPLLSFTRCFPHLSARPDSLSARLKAKGSTPIASRSTARSGTHRG